MADRNYIHEKVWVAIDALCTSDGTFEERFANAVVSGLVVIGPNDADPDTAEDLKVVVGAIREKMKGGICAPFTDDERTSVSQSLLSLLEATNSPSR